MQVVDKPRHRPPTPACRNGALFVSFQYVRLTAQLPAQNLFGFAVKGVTAVVRAVLFDFQSRSVVLFVLFSGVVAVLALAAREGHYKTVLFLCHVIRL